LTYRESLESKREINEILDRLYAAARAEQREADAQIAIEFDHFLGPEVAAAIRNSAASPARDSGPDTSIDRKES